MRADFRHPTPLHIRMCVEAELFKLQPMPPIAVFEAVHRGVRIACAEHEVEQKETQE